MSKKLILTIIVAIVMVGAGAFFWKMLPAAQEATGSLAKFLPKKPAPTAAPMLLRNSTRPFMGPIVSKEGEKLTIKNPDNKNLTIMISDSTKITGGKASDLLAGVKVSGVAKANRDGTLTAQTIQLNPQSPLNKK